MLSSLGVKGAISVELVLAVLSRLAQSPEIIKMKVERVSAINST